MNVRMTRTYEMDLYISYWDVIYIQAYPLSANPTKWHFADELFECV